MRRTQPIREKSPKKDQLPRAVMWRLLPDRPPATDEPDDFGTYPYTQALARLALAAPLPFTVGLFGEWGEGKTTVVGDRLATELARIASPGQSVGYVYFDCWKYQGDPLRRQLIREVAQQLEGQGLLDSATGRRLQADFYASRTYPEFSLQGPQPRAYVALAGQLLLSGLAVVAVFLLLRSFGVEVATAGALSALSPLLLFFVTAFANATVAARSEQVSRNAISAPEVFETRFQELLSSSIADRVVVVVDNLDRTSDDRVLETLGTIKTFLDSESTDVAFIVACDPAAIRRVIDHAGHGAGGLPGLHPESHADEYLRKFFNAKLSLASHLETDLLSYISKLLADAGFPDPHGHMATVIGAALRQSPRRIKQLINVVVARMTLLHLRSGGSPSPDPAAVTKVVALEEAWPDLVRQLVGRPRLLAVWTSYSLGLDTGDKTDDPMPEVDAERFLRATAHVEVGDLLAILQDRRVDLESGVPDAPLFRAELADGDVVGALERLGKAPSAYVSLATEQLKASAGRPAEFIPAASILLRASSDYDEARGGADVAITIIARNKPLRAQLFLLPPVELAKAAARVPDDGGTVLAELIHQFQSAESLPEGWRETVSAALVQVIDDRPEIVGDIKAATEAEVVATTPAALLTLHSGSPALISTKAYERVVDDFSASDIEQETALWRFVSQAAVDMPHPIRDDLHRRLSTAGSERADDAILDQTLAAPQRETPLVAEAIAAIRRSPRISQATQALARGGLDALEKSDAARFIERSPPTTWVSLGTSAPEVLGRVCDLAPSATSLAISAMDPADRPRVVRAVMQVITNRSALLTEFVHAKAWLLFRNALAALPAGRRVVDNDVGSLLIQSVIGGASIGETIEPTRLLADPRVWGPDLGAEMTEAVASLIAGPSWDRGAWGLAAVLAEPLWALMRPWRGEVARDALTELGGQGNSDLLEAAALWQSKYPHAALVHRCYLRATKRLTSPRVRLDRACGVVRTAGRGSEADEHAFLRQLNETASRRQTLTPADIVEISGILAMFKHRRRMRAFRDLRLLIESHT